jgi:hypothetical protein
LDFSLLSSLMEISLNINGLGHLAQQKCAVYWMREQYCKRTVQSLKAYFWSVCLII